MGEASEKHALVLRSREAEACGHFCICCKKLPFANLAFATPPPPDYVSDVRAVMRMHCREGVLSGHGADATTGPF